MFMTSYSVSGKRGSSDERNYGRRCSILVDIFPAGQDRDFSVCYACFLVMLHAYGPTLQSIPWKVFTSFPHSLAQKGAYSGYNDVTRKMESHSIASLSITLAIDNYRKCISLFRTLQEQELVLP